MQNFGRKLKQLRTIQRLSQVEFAAKLQVTQANLSQLEAGKCLPTGTTLARLYELYPNLDFNWIIKGLSGSPFKKHDNTDGYISSTLNAAEEGQTQIF